MASIKRQGDFIVLEDDGQVLSGHRSQFVIVKEKDDSNIYIKMIGMENSIVVSPSSHDTNETLKQIVNLFGSRRKTT